MVARAKPTSRPAAAPPPTSVPDMSPSEHIYIGGEDFNSDPATTARTVRQTVRLNNPLSHTSAELVLYAEGVLRITEERKGKRSAPYFLDLRFLDPIPSIERVVAKRWLITALASIGVAALAAFLLRFDAIYTGAIVTLVTCALLAGTALYLGVRASYERTEYRTLHGRTTALRLTANTGAVKRFRAAVPVLSGAIEEAAERIEGDTAAFLRAEMREHYRLRGAHIIDPESCASGTGRILAQFDVQL